MLNQAAEYFSKYIDLIDGFFGRSMSMGRAYYELENLNKQYEALGPNFIKNTLPIFCPSYDDYNENDYDMPPELREETIAKLKQDYPEDSIEEINERFDEWLYDEGYEWKRWMPSLC